MCRCVGGQGRAPPRPRQPIGKRVGKGAGKSALPTHPQGPKGTPSSFPHRHKPRPPPSSGRLLWWDRGEQGRGLFSYPEVEYRVFGV